jgi:hypothetical protein
VRDLVFLKWIITVWHIFMALFICWTSRGMTWERNKAAVIGFGIMAIMYVMALVLIWGR